MGRWVNGWVVLRKMFGLNFYHDKSGVTSSLVGGWVVVPEKTLSVQIYIKTNLVPSYFQEWAAGGGGGSVSGRKQPTNQVHQLTN